MARAVPFESLLAEHLADPEFRREWERTTSARALAVWLVRYRSEHGLSQRALAERVGMKQPVIARLESGETEPKLSTLLRLAEALQTPIDLELDAAQPAPGRLFVRIGRAA